MIVTTAGRPPSCIWLISPGYSDVRIVWFLGENAYQERRCICGCGKLVPADKRVGTAFYGRECRNRIYYLHRKAQIVIGEFCVNCGHLEDIHCIRRSETDLEQSVLLDNSSTRLCSQYICTCEGFVRPIPDVDELEINVLRRQKLAGVNE